MMKNRKIKILVAIRSLDVGGAEKQVLEFCKHIDKERFDVCLATMYGGVMEPTAEAIDGLYYVNLEKKGRFDIVGFLGSYVGLLGNFEPDIVYAHIGEMNLFSLAAKYLSFKKFKLVWTFHSAFIDYKAYGKFFELLFWLQKKLSRYPDKIICVSHSAYDFHKEAGYDMRKGVVVYNGVDTEHFIPAPALKEEFRNRFGIPQSAFVVGMAARIDKMKGYPLFAAAAATLLPKYENLFFVAAGEGDMGIKDDCKAILADVSNRFVWCGRLDDLREFYNGIDLFCLPSLGEAFGLTVAEAMSCDRAAIVSDAGDMKHIVLSEEFVFKAGDKDELADKIESMILQRFELNIFRKKIVSNFDSRQSVQNIVSELFFND